MGILDAPGISKKQLNAAVGPTAISFGSKRPLVDIGGVYGGGPAVYLPRAVFMVKGGTTINIANAGPAESVEMQGYVKVAIIDTNISYVWFDVATTSYKVSSYIAAPPVLPTEDPSALIEVLSINGQSITSRFDFAYSEDLADQIILPTSPLIVDGATLLIPPYYCRGSGRNFGALNVAADGSKYQKQNMSVTTGTTVAHMHNQAAFDRSLPPLLQVIGNAVPRASGWNMAEIARSLNGVVSSKHAIAGDVPGGSVENQCPYGINADGFTRLLATTTIGNVTNTALTALGFTRGAVDVAGKRPYVGTDLPYAEGGNRAFFRAYYQTDIPGVFGTPRVYIWTSSASVQTINLDFEADISPAGSPGTARIYSVSANIINRNDLLYYLIGTESQATAATVMLAGVQTHHSKVPAWWIRKGDYASALPLNVRVAALEPRLPDTAVNILLPDHLFLNAGQVLPIFAENVMQERSDATNFNLSFSSLKNNRPWSTQSQSTLAIEADRCGPSSTLVSRRFGASRLDSRYKLTLASYVAPATATGAVKTLTIGDSLTNRFTALYLQQLLTTMGLTPTSIGTMNNNGAQAEGRESREYADYIYEHTDAVSPVAVGGEAAYLANEGGKLTSNPFLKIPTAADNTDKPTLIKNGYIFDMAFYLSRFSFDNPDFVIINLGTNDILQQTSAVASAQIAEGMRVMYLQTREALPNAHIGFVTNPRPRGINGDAAWVTQVNAAIIPHLGFVKTKRAAGDLKVWLLPMHAHLSQEAHWTITVSSTDPNTNVAFGTLSDSVHFEETSRRQYAEVTSSWVGALRS